MLKKLKSKAMLLEPVVRIGKAGITNNVVKEIKKQLEKKKLIKIKLLKSFVKGKNKKLVAMELAEKTDSIIVNKVGFTVVLYKKLK